MLLGGRGEEGRPGVRATRGGRGREKGEGWEGRGEERREGGKGREKEGVGEREEEAAAAAAGEGGGGAGDDGTVPRGRCYEIRQALHAVFIFAHADEERWLLSRDINRASRRGKSRMFS